MSNLVVLTFKMVDGSTYHVRQNYNRGNLVGLLSGERCLSTVWRTYDILSGNEVVISFRHVIAARHECDVGVIQYLYGELKKRRTSLKNKLSIADGEPSVINFNNAEYLNRVDNDMKALQNYFNNNCTLCY